MSEARIETYTPDSVTPAPTCEINPKDLNPNVQFVFHHPDGTKHYICQSHTAEYMKKEPKVWANLAHETLQETH